MSIIKDALEAAENLAVKIHKAPKDYNEEDLPTLDEIKSKVSCGSVLLCSGTAAESRLIEEVDGTDFSHSAMVVKLHDDDNLYVWTADTVDKMDDRIHKDSDLKHPGTHLLNFEKYVANLDKFYPSPDGSKYRYAIARLTGVTVDQEKLWSVMYEYDGTPFPPTKDEFLHFIEGQADISSGMSTSFCAQMVANTYQKMGWMNTDNPPNHYSPGSYAKTKEINKELIAGAQLEHAEYFKI